MHYILGLLAIFVVFIALLSCVILVLLESLPPCGEDQHTQCVHNERPKEKK